MKKYWELAELENVVFLVGHYELCFLKFLFLFFSNEKKIFFLFEKKKNQNGRLKKRSFSISANSQYFFFEIFMDGSLG